MYNEYTPKVGDKLKWTGISGSYFDSEQIYTVCRVTGVGDEIKIDLSDSKRGLTKAWSKRNFVPVHKEPESTTVYYISYKDERHQVFEMSYTYSLISTTQNYDLNGNPTTKQDNYRYSATKQYPEMSFITDKLSEHFKTREAAETLAKARNAETFNSALKSLIYYANIIAQLEDHV